ncbi:MAG: LysM peptidoglycan-binding domain-containing protein [Dermatophilaceae bacterium]
MSVALEWGSVSSAPDATGRAPEGAPPRQRHLRLVPPPASAPSRAWRLTRRGRLARTLLVITALMVLALMKPAPGVGDGWLSADHAVTVRSGQTLTDLAVQELPGIAVADGALAIQLLNGLPNAAVYAGQHLQIPAG